MAEVGAVPSAMRAWQYSKFGGGADALQLSVGVPVPKPGAGELLVKVQAATVNPIDWKLQKGLLRPFLPSSLPFIPGLDLAGQVVQVGPGADAFAVGDQVLGFSSQALGGAFAEFALVSLKTAARRPAEVPTADAASLGVAGITALLGLRDVGGLSLGPRVEVVEGGEGGDESAPPKNVAIANASGGVGFYAVQLAKLAGAHVTATSGQRNVELVKSLGADEVLDYKTPEGAALKSPSGRKYDILLDGTSPGTLSWKIVSPVLSPTGRWLHLTPDLSVLGGALLNAVTFSRQKLLPVLVGPNAKDLSTLARLSAGGLLRTRIDAKVPFSEAPEAWRKSIAGHVTGKVTVVSDDSS